jgi:hypothetical protein
MSRLPEYFQVGNPENITQEELLRLMSDMYKTLARAINQKPDVYQRNVDGQVNDTFLSDGTININTATNKVEMLTQHTSTTTVTWVQLS